MIHQFDDTFASPRFFVDHEAGARALHSVDPLRQREYTQHRIGYRRIGRSTDERAMIATVLPKDVFAADSITLCGSVAPRVQCYLVGVLNSFVYDWFMRQKISATLNMFYVYQTPVPRLTEGDPVFEQLATRSAKLICHGTEFDDLAREAGIEPSEGIHDPDERAAIRAELDAVVAHMYGLTEAELGYILQSFPLVDSEVKGLVVEAFRNWKPPSDDPLLRMICAGESARLEFKSSARWDFKLLQVNKTLEHVVVKTIASFMNSDGGTLLIGVADSGEILGLAHDFQTLGSKANADAFENWLTTRLLEAIGRDRIRLLRVSFQTIEGKTVCRVDVDRSSRPVYLAEANGAEKFWVRMGNSTRDLSISEAHAYVDEHFRVPVLQATAASAESAVPDVPPAKPEAQARLPIQASTVSRKVDLSGHGLFRKQDASQPTPVSPKPDVDTEGSDDESPRRRLIDQFEVDDVLAVIRDVVSGAAPMPREDVIKDIATHLGAERVGARIRDFIDGMLNTASRRYIIETRDGGLVASARSIDDYHRDFLKTALKAVIGRTWTDEDEAIRAATRYLGFRRTGPKIERAFKSAINGLLRQDELERDGRALRRRTQ
jgi:hypothetical protein